MRTIYTYQKLLFLSLLTCAVTVLGTKQAAAQLSGAKNIPGDYATLALAITDLNAQGVGSGGVILNMLAGNPETAPAGGYSITATGTSGNPIVITGNSNTITTSAALTAGSVVDAVFKINGGDYITIQGFTMQENPANTTTTLASNNMTEFGVALFYNTVTDGAQNNTIQNNTITLGAATASYPNTFGVYSNTTTNAANGTGNATSSAGTNSGNKVYGNTISGVLFGVVFISPAATASVTETGNDIGGTSVSTGNTITIGNNVAVSASYNTLSTTVSGVQTRNNIGVNVSYNTINTAASLIISMIGVNISHATVPSGVTYTQTASNNTITLTNTGATLTAIDFGAGLSTGTLVAASNAITLNQTSGASASGGMLGIKANYTSAATTINGNTLTINQSSSAGTSSGSLTGINLAATSPALTASNNNITFNQTGIGTAIISSTVTGINYSGSATTINALGNTVLVNQSTAVATGISSSITGFSATTASTTLNFGSSPSPNTITIKQGATGSGTYGAGTMTGIDFGTATHGTVNVLYNVINTTGSTIRASGDFRGLVCNGTVSTGYFVRGNTINVDRVAAAGNVYGLYTSTSPSDVADTISQNTFTFTNISGTSVVAAINSLGGIGATSTPKNINNNIISVSGTTTGAVKGIATGYSFGNITGNQVTLNSAATLIGIDGTGNGVGAYTINNNTLSLTASGNSPAITGITGATTGPYQIFGNTFTTLNASAASTSAPVITVIAVGAGSANNIYNNTVSNVTTGAGSGSATVIGISVAGGTTTNVYKNKISDLSTACTGTSTVINGVRISAGTTVNVYNNLIGNLSVTAASATDAIRGINITSATASTTINAFFNTIYLNASSSGANFGTTGIYHTTSATATTAALNLRNNIIINNSTAAGTGFNVAFRRSSTTLTNYAATSNNNIFYAGTSSSKNLIFYDGTNADSTIAQFKTRVSTRDAASASENVAFVSTSSANASFLMINPSTPTQVESGALPTSPAVTDDYAGTTRNSTTPDIGAFEGSYTLQDLTAPAISFSDLTNSSSTTTRVFTNVAIVDPSGVNTTSGTRPRLYYKKTTEANTYTGNTNANNGWKWVEASNTTSPFSFTIDYSLLVTSASVGDTIQYFIAAQDNSGNANTGVSNGTLATAATSVALTGANFPISGTIKSFRIVNSLSGTVTVGTGGTYTSLTNAGGLFDDINNNKEVTGNVTAQIISDLTAETGTFSLGQFSSAYGLSIVPNAAVSRTISGNPQFLVPIAGADNVTIDGRFGGSGSYLNFTNTNATTTSIIFFVFPATGTSNGSQNLTIRNCILTNGSTDVGSTANVNIIHMQGDGHSNISIQYNTFRKATAGIIIGAGTVTTPYTGVNISNNTFGDDVAANYLSNAGVRVFNSKNAVVSNNLFKNLTTVQALDIVNIEINSGSDSATVSNNLIYGSRSTNSGGYGASGVSVTSGNAALIMNNVIYDIGGSSYNIGHADALYGIRIISGSNHRIYNNSTSLSGAFNSSTSTYTSAAIGVLGGTGHDIRNNNFSNTMTGVSGVKSYAIVRVTGATFGTINNNNYYAAGTNAVLGSFDGTDKTTLAAWAASSTQDAASVVFSPAYTSATNLLPVSCNYNNKGQVLSAVTTDFTGAGRNAATPDIGAYEFNSGTITAPAAASPVNYCQNATATALSATGSNTLLWFTTASGGAGTTTAPTPVTTASGTTPYYVADSSASSGCISARTQVSVVVTAPVATNTASGTQTICSGSAPTALTGSTPTGGNGSSYTYRWLKSTTDALTGFSNAGGNDSAQHYTSAALTQTTWFRRMVTSGACASDTAVAVQVTVNTAIAGNTASGTQAVCSGSIPAALTGSTPTGGNGTTYTYVWLSSTTSASAGFTAAAGTNNSKDYSPAALTQNTWFKRVVTSGVCAADTTAAVAITVNTAIAGNTASGTQTICSSATPTVITGSTPTGGNGSAYTYAWISSTTSATAGFSAASGTANAKDYSPATLSASTWFRRVVTSGACAADTSAAVKITVTTPITTNTITSSPQTICSGSGPSTITGSVPTGGDGSSYTYTWVRSTTGATTGFTTASGLATAQNYSPTGLTQNTWFRRIVTSGSCAADTAAAIKITVTTAVANNTASGTQTICSGSVPTALTGSTPTGGDGATYTYTWLSSTTSATAGFSAASGTNSTQNYSPAALSANTWYKRVVSSGACAADTSAAVSITVNAAIANNTATGAQNICSGSTPAALSGSTPTGGNGSSYTYTWLSSTTSATAGFSAASGTNSTQNYSPAALSANTWYKRVVSSGVCTNDTSAAVAITVNTAIAGNTASGTQSICSGSVPTAITGSTPTGGNGSTYTYAWISSTTSASAGFSAATGTANAKDYSPAALSASTWYKRIVTSGACPADTSAAVAITVNTAIAGNTITGAQSICSGSTPSLLNGSTPSGGNGSSYFFQWLSSTTSATAGFTAAAGTNNTQNYAPAALTQNTWFRRRATSGACAADTSAAVQITVTTGITGNTASGAQTICSGSTPSALTGSTPTGGNGSSYTYTWISSTTSASAGFSAASGTNTNQNYSPAALSANTWFRRVVSSGACSADTSAAVAITVNTAIAGNTASGAQSICSGSTPTALTGSTPTGGNGSTYTYTWLSSTTSASTGFFAASGTNSNQNYSPAALSVNTWFKRVVSSGVCSNDTSAAVAVTVNTAIANNSATGPQTICSGNTPASLIGSTPTGGDGSNYAYLWLSSTTSATTGFSPAAGGGNNVKHYSPLTLTQNTWFRRVVTSGACLSDTSAAILITVTNTNTWTGATGSIWSTATNWGCGRIPVMTDSVVIVPASNPPVVIDNRSVNSITVTSGASLTLNGSSVVLSIGGVFTLNGTLTSLGEILMNGTAPQVLPGAAYQALTIDNPAGVSLTGPATVSGILTLTNGKLTLNNNNLTLTGTSGVIAGAGATKYIRTNGTGALTIQSVGGSGRSNAISFHVGNSAYNPVTINNNLGTSDAFSVNVIDSVTNTYTGTTPTGVKLTANAVNRTWIINEAVAGGSNATVTLQWNTADELSGFSRASSYISRYNGTTWLPNTASAATGSNPYVQTRSGITAFSPFGVGSGSTLPVSMLNFTAVKTGRSVSLAWTTASEVNNDHFIIERSTDNRSFEQVGKVTGKGNTSLTSSYLLNDDVSMLVKQHAGMVYYRLTQFDFDGNKHEAGTAAVNIAEKVSGIAVNAQPNPFTSSLSLDIQLTDAAQVKIEVIDVAGKLVAEQSSHLAAGSNEVALQHADQLSDGLYFINVHTASGVFTHKVVKGH